MTNYYSTALGRELQPDLVRSQFGFYPDGYDLDTLNDYYGLFPINDAGKPTRDTNLYSGFTHSFVPNADGNTYDKVYTPVERPLADAQELVIAKLKDQAEYDSIVALGGTPVSTNNSNSEFSPNGPYEQVGGESQLILTSQSYLAASSRIEPYKGIAVSMNTIATKLTSSVAAVQAATDIDEVNAAYKPSGVINTGRSGASVNDLAPSYFSSLSNMPEGVDQSGLELYVPGTGIIMPYIPTLPSPFKFDSWGDCFVSGDYRLVIRVAATGQVLSTVYPEAGANQNISWTYNPNIPAA